MKTTYLFLFFLAVTLNTSGQNFFSTGRRTSGYVNISEFGYAPSIDGRAGAITVSTINGYKPNDHFSAGLGVSYTRFSNGPTDIVNFLPIFADLRTYIGGRTALMLVGDIGYGLLLDKRIGNKGDLYINPAIGIRTYVAEKSALVFSVGYLSQYVLNQAVYNGDRYDRSEHSDNVSIKLGFLF
ncbi:hypothetical protein [Spirosoma fluviale]|uniref:Outer membrane protein beta-barrel domain-containing protein n=1 Tax=Spirosoma fluviale TaxID=1597977 RepID=A0A286GBZ6_9BACT|nr:hypothetical protein [Spirosoma fluviale]SOD92639.1 hypothetical protein SAMN06269250_4082 [Spirosoma fluviale]